MGDAISHAILPGIVIAFLFSNSRDPFVMLLGAGLIGLFATFLIEWISKTKVSEDSSTGIVFTVLFSIGVILVSIYSRNIDLDAECVLFGELALVPLQSDFPSGSGIPRSTFTLLLVYGINVGLISLLYKEWKVSTFDSLLASSLGFSVGLLHYLLMGAVSLTTVAGFEATGAILIVAMFIAPALTALLLFHRLSYVLIATQVISLIITVAGYGFAKWIDSSIAGAMATVAGLLFLLVVFFSPDVGIWFKWLNMRALKQRIAMEDLIGMMFRFEERGETSKGLAFSTKLLKRGIRRNLILHSNQGYILSKDGKQMGALVVRSHRLWESYLEQELQLPPDHTHDSADNVEHFLGSEERVILTEVLKNKTLDPQGKKIPEE